MNPQNQVQEHPQKSRCLAGKSPADTHNPRSSGHQVNGSPQNKSTETWPDLNCQAKQRTDQYVPADRAVTNI